ncbi:hypothetical protein [Lactovum odontotermitis]
MSNINRKTMKISEIDNFIDNPRTESAKNSFDEIKKLYGETQTSRKQLMNLAESIAVKGYDSTEAIIVVSENNKYVAYDGNRRVAALKLLLNYDNFDFLADSDIKILKKLSEGSVIPNSVEVVIKSKNDALDYMQRVHGGQQEGIGHTDWSSENKRRFYERRGGYVLTNELNKGFEKEFGTNITEELPVTTIDRILGNKDIKIQIGLKKDQVDFSRNQLELVRNVLQEAKQISEKEGKAVTRTFATSKDISEKLIPALSLKKGQITNLMVQDNARQGSDSSRATEKNTKVLANLLFPLKNTIPSNYNHKGVKLIRDIMTVIDQLFGREKYNVVIAPSLRSIFELSFNLLREKELFSIGKNQSINSDNAFANVLIEISKSKTLTKVADQIGNGYTYQTLKKQFEDSIAICNMYNKSNDGAHKSSLSYSADDIKNIANKAELFAIVALHFVFLEEDYGEQSK